MNREEIIDTAVKAGMHIDILTLGRNVELLDAFAKRIAQHEREACAIVCDDINAKYKWPDDVAERVASQWCADSIRARGQK